MNEKISHRWFSYRSKSAGMGQVLESSQQSSGMQMKQNSMPQHHKNNSRTPIVKHLFGLKTINNYETMITHFFEDVCHNFSS